MEEERRLLTLKLELRGMQEQVLQRRAAEKAEEVETVHAREEDTPKELRRVLQRVGLLKGTARGQHRRLQMLNRDPGAEGQGRISATLPTGLAHQ